MPSVDSLPRWAREEMESLRKRCDATERRLREYLDSQTPGPFFQEDLTVRDRKVTFDRRYIQANTIRCTHGGVSIQVFPLGDGDGIGIRMGAGEEIDGGAAIEPQAANLVHVRALA